MARRGFTLMELLVTLAVAAATLAFAVPSFNDLLAAQRGAAAINQMVGAIALARSQAVLQRHTITLCPGRGDACLGHDHWHEGALAFVDRNRDGRRDSGDLSYAMR